MNSPVVLLNTGAEDWQHVFMVALGGTIIPVIWYTCTSLELSIGSTAAILPTIIPTRDEIEQEIMMIKDRQHVIFPMYTTDTSELHQLINDRYSENNHIMWSYKHIPFLSEYIGFSFQLNNR